MKKSKNPADSPLDKHTVDDLELQERLINKYIEEGMTREEATMYALADLREKNDRQN